MIGDKAGIAAFAHAQQLWGLASCPADINGDRIVDGIDLAVTLSQWGATGSADINGDGIVDGADLGAILSGWGTCN